MLKQSTLAPIEYIASRTESLREHCRGVVQLDARLELWMQELLVSKRFHQLVNEHGSPLNIIEPSAMTRNGSDLERVAKDRAVDFRIFFARKSNKCFTFVNQALDDARGLDTASENEITQCLECGASPSDIICTAAVKSESLIRLCVVKSICIAVDNQDELGVICNIATSERKDAIVAIRLGGFQHQGNKLLTRFGFDVHRDRNLVAALSKMPVQVAGVHFHLDGYDGSQRVSALIESLLWIEELRGAGHDPKFIDMGGGFPMSYLDDGEQWEAFWNEHARCQLGERVPITYQNHGLGLTIENGAVVGHRNTYPYYQTTIRDIWFSQILNTLVNGKAISLQLNEANLQLRCEPGRSLLDGCGITVARVEFRKQNADGDWLIGLSMNRTQCRTSSDDFLVDPIVVPCGNEPSKEMQGYLVGAYCTESEFLSLRKLIFPRGVHRGDLVVFPNTAGYLMHFLESRSHHFPLATNLIANLNDNSFVIDGCETWDRLTACHSRDDRLEADPT